MAEQPTFYDTATRKRIGDAVRGWEAGDDGRGPGRERRAGYGDIWLARADDDYANGTVGTFTWRVPNGNKGSEIDGTETFSAYVRFGECVSGQLYYLIETCGADDVILEVVQSASGAVITDATADEWAFASDSAVDFTSVTYGAISAVLYRGLVIAGNVYRLHKVGSTYQVLDPTLVVVGTALAAISQGNDGPVDIIDPSTGTSTGVTLTAYNRLQASVADESMVECRFVETIDSVTPGGHQWELIGEIDAGSATPSIAGTPGANVLAGATGSFTTSLGSITALVSRGLCLAGEDYVLTWVEDHWEVADPELAVTGNADAFAQFGDSPSNFSVGASTITATLSRGLVLASKDFGLVWAVDHWAVVDPELTITGTADDYYFGGPTAADFSVGAATVEANLLRGMVFDGATYRLEWVDDEWQVADPAMRFRGVANASIAESATTGDVSVYEWTGSAWADTGEDLTDVLNDLDVDIESGAVVKCEFVEPTGDRAMIYQSDFTCPEE